MFCAVTFISHCSIHGRARTVKEEGKDGKGQEGSGRIRKDQEGEEGEEGLRAPLPGPAGFVLDSFAAVCVAGLP